MPSMGPFNRVSARVTTLRRPKNLKQMRELLDEAVFRHESDEQPANG